MATATIATINNTTPMGRRLNSWLSSLRQVRNDGYGVRADAEAVFAALGFVPASPTPDSAAAVALTFGLPDASHVPAALAGMALLAQMDFTVPLSHFTSPVG